MGNFLTVEISPILSESLAGRRTGWGDAGGLRSPGGAFPMGIPDGTVAK